MVWYYRSGDANGLTTEHTGVTFLRALVGLDNWDDELESVTNVEDVLQKYSEQYHKEYNTSALYQLV
jgi:hypothetical protein